MDIHVKFGSDTLQSLAVGNSCKMCSNRTFDIPAFTEAAINTLTTQPQKLTLFIIALKAWDFPRINKSLTIYTDMFFPPLQII